jgi:hypothetical protein
MDYTVIEDHRQHFGDEEDYLTGHFVGSNADFPFDCPEVDPTQTAVLMFQSLDVDNDKNALEINGQRIVGGIPTSPSKDTWNSNVMLVAPNTLRQTGNTLTIGARRDDGALLPPVDDFVIDNVVIFYKTRS